MPDPRPLPDRLPHEPRSGRELTLTTRGIIERVKGGDQAAVVIAQRLLRQLLDDDGTMQGKAPEALATCRLKLLTLLQADAHFRARLAADLGDEIDTEPRQAIAMSHTAECALRHGGDACDCIEIVEVAE